MMIEPRPCPRCAIRRTARLDTWGVFCFNCRFRLDGGEVDAPMRPSEVPPCRLQPAELARLERYRAAVQAGLYTDWPRGARPLSARTQPG
jgi:hypothetical protein